MTGETADYTTFRRVLGSETAALWVAKGYAGEALSDFKLKSNCNLTSNSRNALDLFPVCYAWSS